MHHHNDLIIIILILPLTRTDLHELRHQSRRRHQLIVYHLLLVSIMLSLSKACICGALATDITYPVPLTHKLVCLGHLH